VARIRTIKPEFFTSPDVAVTQTTLRVGESAVSFAMEIARMRALPWPLYMHWDVDDYRPFPEWIHDPNDRIRWRELNVPGHWFVYAAFPDRTRPPRPIYIGMTSNLERRLIQHQRSRWWWGEVDHFIVSLADTKREALENEKRYIHITSPCYNTQHYRESDV
jgi:predicted GIY-YIG superfamily endonuclease